MKIKLFHLRLCNSKMFFLKHYISMSFEEKWIFQLWEKTYLNCIRRISGFSSWNLIDNHFRFRWFPSWFFCRIRKDFNILALNLSAFWATFWLLFQQSIHKKIVYPHCQKKVSNKKSCQLIGNIIFVEKKQAGYSILRHFFLL